MARRKQLTLAIRLFNVRCDDFGETRVQAATRDAAKYAVFKQAREAGYFRDTGFRGFLEKGWVVTELHQPFGLLPPPPRK